MTRPVETEPGNHGLAISALVHDIQSLPIPDPDKNLGQAISGGIHGMPIPEPEFHFGQLVSAFVHAAPIPDPDFHFGQLVSTFVHALHSPSEVGPPAIDALHQFDLMV